jgi:hypothetical protein
MPRYQIVTLVDITRTNPTRSETDPRQLGQQANFNTLLQSIGLRSNVEWTVDPTECKGILPYPLEGRANYWTWTFEVERDQVFVKDRDPVGLLVDDLHGVPVIGQLNNSVDIDPAVFQTRGKQANIWITQIDEIG